MLIAPLKLLLKIKRGDKRKGSEESDRTEISMADILSASNGMNFDIDLKGFTQDFENSGEIIHCGISFCREHSMKAFTRFRCGDR